MALPFADEFADGQWKTAFLDTNGDETGNINMGVDGSITPVEFMITAPTGYTYYIHRFIGLIVDTGSIDTGGYGNGPALTNGVDVLYRHPVNGDVLFTAQKNLKTNVDYGSYCYDITHHDWGLGDEALAWRYTMTRDGAPFKLQSGHSFVFKVQDDLSGLTEQSVRCGIVSVPNQYTRR